MVHTYSMNEINIAVDGNSGSIHILDDVSRDMLTQFKKPFTYAQAAEALQAKYTTAVIEEAWEEINSLIKKGLLFSPETDQELILNHNNSDNDIKALCLHIANDCNLTCAYCFAANGMHQAEKKLMPEEVAFKAVDFLINNSGSKKNIEIDFFGGEPTLNFPVIKKTVEYGKKVAASAGKKLNFTITTNGTMLDDKKIKYINDNMDNVVISIDGRPAVHDAMRRAAGGRSAYNRIVGDALRLVRARENKGKSYFIRGTFTAKNTDFSKDVFHLADQGFNEISLEPVVGKGADFHIRQEHLPEILAEYEQLAGEYIKRTEAGKPFKFYHFNVNIYEGPCLYKRTAACGAGTEYLAVTPEGDLYPCHQFTGQREFILGNLNTGIHNHKLREQFGQSNIFTKESCRDCWAKLYCSGGCHANAYYTNGNILQPEELVCAMQKKRLECAIMIEARKDLTGKKS